MATLLKMVCPHVKSNLVDLLLDSNGNTVLCVACGKLIDVLGLRW